MRIATLLTVALAWCSLCCKTNEATHGPASVATEPDIAAPVENETLRVMTFNIHHGAGTDGKIDLERIAKVITSANPDVVAVQEVHNKTTRVNGVDQGAELGRLTGMNVHFGPAFDWMGGQYGQVILSKSPITSFNVVQLPKLKDEQRIALISEINQPGGPLRFVATHLTHNNNEERIGQTTALLDTLAQLKPMPTILAGDMNAMPGSKPIVQFLEAFDDTTGDDALTSPATQPVRKIDWILLGKGHPWKVTEKRVIDDALASDHRAVVVELENKEKES